MLGSESAFAFSGGWSSAIMMACGARVADGKACWRDDKLLKPYVALSQAIPAGRQVIEKSQQRRY